MKEHNNADDKVAGANACKHDHNLPELAKEVKMKIMRMKTISSRKWLTILLF